MWGKIFNIMPHLARDKILTCGTGHCVRANVWLCTGGKCMICTVAKLWCSSWSYPQGLWCRAKFVVAAKAVPGQMSDFAQGQSFLSPNKLKGCSSWSGGMPKCLKPLHVAGGHLTDIPIDSVYLGVVSLRCLCIVTFLAKLNDLDLWATDVGNAYLEALTKEKIYIIASPEICKLEGHIIIIRKALYGLHTSGLRWHETFADCLRSLGFEPCWAEPDIWMWQVDDHYEYVPVYIDDLEISSKDPKAITDALTDCHGFKLKGIRPIGYHLGMTFCQNEHGLLEITPRWYINKMVDAYVSNLEWRHLPNLYHLLRRETILRLMTPSS